MGRIQVDRIFQKEVLKFSDEEKLFYLNINDYAYLCSFFCMKDKIYIIDIIDYFR